MGPSFPFKLLFCSFEKSVSSLSVCFCMNGLTSFFWGGGGGVGCFVV